MKNRQTRKQEYSKHFLAGCKASVPVSFGYIPAALTFSGIALNAGCTPLQTAAMSALFYSGAGQMSVCSMIASGSSLLLIVITVVILNLRHVIMSSIVLSDNPGVSKGKMFWLLSGLTDEVFGLYAAQKDALTHNGSGDDKNRSFPGGKEITPAWLFGLALCSWLWWQLGTWIGLAALSRMPGLILNAFSCTLYAMFIALLIQGIRSRPVLLYGALLAALLNWLLSFVISSSIAIIISAAAAACVLAFFIPQSCLKKGESK